MRKILSKEKNRWAIFAVSALVLLLSGCEVVVSDLIEIDENGNRINNADINLQKILYQEGLKGYAIDSVYTEFGFVEGESTRIDTFKKGRLICFTNGAIDSIAWDTLQPTLVYGGGSYDLRYRYKDLESEIILNDHYFAEEVTMRYVDDDVIHAKLYYRYYDSGYLSQVVLERPDMEPVTISYIYPDASYSGTYVHSPVRDGGIIIKEGDAQYHISLTKVNIENKGYVCNALRYANAPLTNEYVIISDLYYLGLYGTPIRYLPDVVVTRTMGKSINAVLGSVGNCKYFYHD